MIGNRFVVHHMKAVQQDFEAQASIYVDACFLLAILDKTNGHRETIFDLLDDWGTKGIVIGISNHVIHEVTNVLLKNTIHKTLELAFLKSHTSGFYKQKWQQLREGDQAQLGDEAIAQRLLYSAEELFPGRIKRRHHGDRDAFVNVQEVLKDVKRTLHDRAPLHYFYRVAKNTFEAIIQRLESLGLIIEYLESDAETLLVAKQYMELFQLEPTDALHLAVTRCNHYDYLVTLDGDFVHSFYTTGQMGETKIYKIGA